MTDEVTASVAQPRLSADEPITKRANDAFEIAPFCDAVAQAISLLDPKLSFVIALNGSWGVGKSSAVNLVKEKLADGAVSVLDFNPWSASGRDDLAWEFLSLIAAQLDSKNAKHIMRGVRNLRKRGKDAATSIGGLLGAGASLLDDFTWQSLQAELTKKLGALEASRRFLVVVDDIDRLDHDEIFEVFRLIKTIGHLPRVTYLLVFDQSIATAAIEDRYPSQGAAYLEKIVQVSFTLPPPSPEQLVEAGTKSVQPLRDLVEDDQRVRFENVFHDIVAPSLSTPRDVARLANHITIGWPIVKTEVSPADFMGVQGLKAFYPAVFDSLPTSKLLLIRSVRGSSDDREARSARYDRRLAIDRLPDPDSQRLVRNALQRLFPALEGVWSNRFYDDNSYQIWRRDRRVCTTEHFDTYFRLSPSAYALPSAELNALKDKADDVQFLRTTFREALTRPRRPQGTRASLILEELTLYAAQWPLDVVRRLCLMAAEMSDELDVVADEERGFSFGSNLFRVRWLLNVYIDRLEQSDREAFYKLLIESAGLGFAVTFVSGLLKEHITEKDEPEDDDKEPRVSAEFAYDLRDIALSRIVLAAANRSILQTRSLTSVLYRWADWAEPSDVSAWVNDQLHFPEAFSILCEALTSITWSQGLGLGDGLHDHVARGTPRVDAASLSGIMEFDEVEQRARTLLTEPLSREQHARLTQFIEGVELFRKSSDR